MEDLLIKYYEGSLSTEDSKRVEAWIRSSKENAEIARFVLQATLAIDSEVVMKCVNTDNALERVNKQIIKKKAISCLVWMERAAAVLFIPLLIASSLLWEKDTFKEVRMIVVKTNPGMTTDLSLPDGTKVSLNSGSILTYPEIFSGNERKVMLSGEAFFEVARDEEKKFIVETLHATKVEVLGTAFNLEAFSNDSLISTTLIRGKVCFDNGGSTTYLLPGEKLVYNVNSKQLEKNMTSGICETAWKDNKLVFQNTIFDEAMRMLEKRFNVDVVVTSDKYKKDAFTGSFTDQRLDRILEIFKLSSGIHWRYDSSANLTDKKSKIIIY